MVVAAQLIAGMVILVGEDPFLVEDIVKVSAKKASPFIKVKIRGLISQKREEKNFRPNQNIEEVCVEEYCLEYLYPEEKNHVFLNLDTLDMVSIPNPIVGEKIDYLKEGIGVKASGVNQLIFSISLPQFLELMVASIKMVKNSKQEESGGRIAVLETGAEIDVPLFVDIGDVIKVDTIAKEYIQRV